MSLALAFWILMLIWLVWSLPFNTYQAQAPWGGSILLFVLLAVLGWHVFGPAIHG